MAQKKYPAVFMRGGTSKAIMFQAREDADIDYTFAQVQVREAGDRLRLAMPSGVLAAGARTSCDNGVWRVASGSFCRSARRLFEGCVFA